MTEHPSFTNAIGEVASDLRNNAGSYSHLTLAATRIDHLGRQLHGLDYAREGEIAACFTIAVRSLLASRGHPENTLATAAHEAASQLEYALISAAEGCRS